MSSHRYRLSARARIDLASTLRWSLQKFGGQAAARYKHLIETAFLQLADNPGRQGSRALLGVRLYHLRLSRHDAPLDGLIVKKPRHFIVYQASDAGEIDVIRILHDQMDIEHQIDEN